MGYPFWDSEPGKNERTESKPYIDYALFFTEDITKKNIKLWTITIPSGTNCCIKKKQFKKSGRKIFLPPKCEVSTEDNIDEGSEYVKLLSYSFNVFVYSDGIDNGKLKDKASTKLYLPDDNFIITLVNGKFGSISKDLNDDELKIVKALAKEIIQEMKTNSLTEGKSKDYKPITVYKYKVIKTFSDDTYIKDNVLDKENMHFIETYSCSQPYEPAATEAVYSKIFLPSDLKKTYIGFRRYYKFKIKDKICYVNRKIIDKNKENPLEEFGKKGLTINLKTNPISKKSICPEDKLVLDKKNINEFKQNLIDKLSEENEDLIQYVTPVDGTEDYNIYIVKISETNNKQASAGMGFCKNKGG